MVITCPQDDVTISLYMSGNIFVLTLNNQQKKQLEDCPRIVLTSQNDWYPHSIRFPTGPQREEEEYLFAGIVEIHVDSLQRKFHET